jgi:protocatechuate 3,4-dioxygenase beta subunit
MRLALLLISIASYAQEAGTVAGTVTNSATHAPVPGVNVTFTRRAAGRGDAPARAITDASGKYRSPGLPPGDYSIRFETADYVPATCDVEVNAAGIRVNQELAPAASLSGRVLDHEGNPATDVPVEIYRFRSRGPVNTGRTAADGQFRFERLAPGSYALVARPAFKPKDGAALAPTWYAGATERARSERIIVQPGAVLSGYAIRLSNVPVWPVAGNVIDEEGKPVANASIALRPIDDRDEATISTSADGTFRFPAVRPGEWQLVASLSQAKKGFARIMVDKHDVERVTIRVYPPFTLEGVVEREEPRDENGKRLVSGVSLQPVDGQGESELAFHEQDGSVRFKKVQPGKYIIFPLGFKPGYYLDAVLLGDRDVFGKPVDLNNGALRFRVVYEPNAGRVRGAVENGADRTVVLLPQDESMLDGQFIRTARCDAQGRFEVGSLKPGEYYAFAFDRIDYDALSDVQFVRNLVNSAVRVHVDADRAAEVELKTTSWPE